MGKKYDGGGDVFWNEEGASEYYGNRLSTLVRTAEAKGRAGLLLDSDHLLADTPAVLERLTAFLDLRQPLTPDYEIFEKTGAPRYGDPSENIKLGTMTNTSTDFDVVLSENVRVATRKSYQDARSRLEAALSTVD